MNVISNFQPKKSTKNPRVKTLPKEPKNSTEPQRTFKEPLKNPQWPSKNLQRTIKDPAKNHQRTTKESPENPQRTKKEPTKKTNKEPTKNEQLTQKEPKKKPPKNPQRSPKRTKKEPSKTPKESLDSQIFIQKPHNQLCPTCSKHMKSKFRKKLAQKNDWQVTGVHLHVSNLQL